MWRPRHPPYILADEVSTLGSIPFPVPGPKHEEEIVELYRQKRTLDPILSEADFKKVYSELLHCDSVCECKKILGPCHFKYEKELMRYDLDIQAIRKMTDPYFDHKIMYIKQCILRHIKQKAKAEQYLDRYSYLDRYPSTMRDIKKYISSKIDKYDSDLTKTNFAYAMYYSLNTETYHPHTVTIRDLTYKQKRRILNNIQEILKTPPNFNLNKIECEYLEYKRSHENKCQIKIESYGLAQSELDRLYEKSKIPPEPVQPKKWSFWPRT